MKALGPAPAAASVLCGASRVSNNRCAGSAISHSAASITCAAAGGRLCSAAELGVARAGVSTGCKLNKARVWTDTPSGHNSKAQRVPSPAPSTDEGKGDDDDDDQ